MSTSLGEGHVFHAFAMKHQTCICFMVLMLNLLKVMLLEWLVMVPGHVIDLLGCVWIMEM